jgi:O-glycosyl hydrolase
MLARSALMFASTGRFADSIALENPDGTRVVELLNAQTTAAQVVVGVDGRRYTVQIPPTSVAAVMVPGR